MSINFKAGVYTALVLLGVSFFIGLVVLTDGAAFLLLFLAIPTVLIYTSILDGLKRKERQSKGLKYL